MLTALAIWILPAVLGTLLGGASLFALLAHGQVRPEMIQATDDADRNPEHGDSVSDHE